MSPSREEFLHIGAGEYVFYFLIYLSLAIMFWQIVQRVRLWMQGRPVEERPGGWRYWIPRRDDLRRWLGNFWVYGLEQRKVRSSRRKSGAPMHLLIFYGFLSLFLATTILAINTYGPWKFDQGVFYETYETTFDLLGLLLVVGLVWALIRRVLISRKGRNGFAKDAKTGDPALTSSWGDFATLVLLLIIAVTGYWLEAARISNDPKPWDSVSVVGYQFAGLLGHYSDGMYVFVWWFHVGWILIFFATLPRMRIRHIVMAVLTTAGRTDQPMGELTPIAMAEVEQTGQIGVASAQDYSRWHLMSLDACMECGRCTEVCPAWNVGKVLNPKRVVQDIRRAMESASGLNTQHPIPNTPSSVAETIGEESLWACTTCNACVEACPVTIRHVDMIVDARRWLVAEGKLSGSGATMLRQVGSTDHAWGQPRGNREDWMKGLDIPLCRNGVEFEWLLWVGCAGATDPGAAKTTKAVAKLLKKAGVSFACLGQEEGCTGDPARRIGDEFLFQEKAMGNAALFQRYGVKKIVTPCPHCFNTLKNEYGQAFLDGGDGDDRRYEVLHHSQLLAQLVREGKLKAASGEDTVFHDPCYLARVNNESDAPRALFGEDTSYNDALSPEASFLVPQATSRNPQSTLREAPHRARKTLCCGAGGGRMWMEEPASQRPSNRRAEELVATGASTVAVGCPFCRIMIGDALKQVSEREINLVDLAEALQRAN